MVVESEGAEGVDSIEGWRKGGCGTAAKLRGEGRVAELRGEGMVVE